MIIRSGLLISTLQYLKYNPQLKYNPTQMAVANLVSKFGVDAVNKSELDAQIRSFINK